MRRTMVHCAWERVGLECKWVFLALGSANQAVKTRPRHQLASAPSWSQSLCTTETLPQKTLPCADTRRAVQHNLRMPNHPRHFTAANYMCTAGCSRKIPGISVHAHVGGLHHRPLQSFARSCACVAASKRFLRPRIAYRRHDTGVDGVVIFTNSSH